jgi:hypothetical protein
MTIVGIGPRTSAQKGIPVINLARDPKLDQYSKVKMDNGRNDR